jgi:hypothetical protein
MAKILVLINSGPDAPVKVTSGLVFARVAHDRGAEVRVVLFGDGVFVPFALERHPAWREDLDALRERGLRPRICKGILEEHGHPTELPGFEVAYIGADLVAAVDAGFQVISF